MGSRPRMVWMVRVRLLISATLCEPMLSWNAGAFQVLSEQKIGDTTGGFTGTLDNSDWFGGGVGNIGDIDGDGVVDRIRPYVDSGDPLAFPLFLEFNTPTANFEMQGLRQIRILDLIKKTF